MTVKELTMHLWYCQKIVIVKESEMFISNCLLIDDIKKIALWIGENADLRSIRSEHINQMYVKNYGVIDNYLIIETM